MRQNKLRLLQIKAKWSTLSLEVPFVVRECKLAQATLPWWKWISLRKTKEEVLCSSLPSKRRRISSVIAAQSNLTESRGRRTTPEPRFELRCQTATLFRVPSELKRKYLKSTNSSRTQSFIRIVSFNSTRLLLSVISPKWTKRSSHHASCQVASCTSAGRTSRKPKFLMDHSLTW